MTITAETYVYGSYIVKDPMHIIKLLSKHEGIMSAHRVKHTIVVAPFILNTSINGMFCANLFRTEMEPMKLKL